MATSSILKKFVIEDEKEAEAFWTALEKSEKDSGKYPVSSVPVHKADKDWIKKNLQICRRLRKSASRGAGPRTTPTN